MKMTIISNKPLSACAAVILELIDDGCYEEDLTGFTIEKKQGAHSTEPDLLITNDQTGPMSFTFLSAQKFKELHSGLNHVLSLPSRPSRMKQKNRVIDALSGAVDAVELDIPHDANDDLWEMIDCVIAWVMKEYDGILDSHDGFFDKDLQKIYKL